MKKLISFLVLTMALGCGDSQDGGTAGSGGMAGSGGSGGEGGTGGQDFSPDPPLVIGGDERPSEVDIPTDYDPTVSYPLLMVLHGAGADGRTQAGYFQLFSFVDEKQFVMVFPDGTPDEGGRRLWNGAVCCTQDDNVDDVGYLSGLIEEAKQTYNIDASRVYLIGHSNGGFMSFRMACEVSPLFTAMASLAGGTYEDPANCQPGTPPVSVLVIHGTADETILYDGEPGFSPGAIEIIERSAAAAGCDPDAPTPLGSVDLVPAVDGEETDMVAYSTGCDEGLDAELWTINEGGHIPFFTTDFADMATDWLFRHTR
jgi:polyhydroxybutyrate depolymerase